MSSSSSIAAARRRRAGGPPGPTPPGSNSSRPSQNNPPTSQQEPPSGPLNPLMILQQHHIKINTIEKLVTDLASKQEFITRDITTKIDNTTQALTTQTQMPSSQLDINELSDLVMSKVEGQMDLKAFYDNDSKLMEELEELKKTVQSQQLVINGMNTTLFTLITRLDTYTANKEAEEKAKKEAEEKAKKEAEEKAKKEAEEKAKKAAEEKAKKEAEEKAKKATEEQARNQPSN
jgi:hypothetical protein